MTDIESIPRHRRLLYGFIFFVLLPVLIVLGAEITGRVIVHYKYGVSGKSFGLWRYDQRLGAIHAENAYNTYAETNDHGFRNREDVLEPKPAGAYRIVAYGGSTTFCFNLANEEAWPIRLQGLLRKAHHAKDQVLNAGAVSWSLGHAYARAQRELPTLRPDYVIIYSGINEESNDRYLRLHGIDMEEAVSQGKFGIFDTDLDQSNSWVMRNFLLVKFFRYYIKPNDGGPTVYLQDGCAGSSCRDGPNQPDSILIENYRKTLGAFLDLIERVGAKPIFVIQAHARGMGVNTRWLSYSRAGAGIARDAGAVVIDAQEIMDAYKGASKDLFYEVTGVHWSALGAKQLAEHIFHSSFAGIAADASIAPGGLSNPQ